MNITQKIPLGVNTENDKFIKVKLEQSIDSLEFMSLKINSTDIYQSFNSDYGVLVGRVVANNNIGVPNAKISIFIPLADEDINDPDIVSIYPYTTPSDKNNEGKRYNLLPRVGRFGYNSTISKPIQPFGSFPIEEELNINQTYLNVYKKYYKYTAVTNQFGDYMIFGVPIGTQIVHMSVDVTDIGKYSMSPAAMITNLGYSPNLFTGDGTRIKPSSDLTDLPHIELQDISVDVIPFWGDENNFEIGITRQDFKIKAIIVNTFTIFGNIFTDGENSIWGNRESSASDTERLYYINDGQNIEMKTKRTGVLSETVFYYPPEVSDEEINSGVSGNTNINSKMLVLSKNEYTKYVDDNGNFVLLINCNRNKKIYNDQNIEVEVNYNNNDGVFTEFKGFVVFEINESSAPINFSNEIFAHHDVFPFRYKIKVPQESDTQIYNSTYFTFDKTESYNTIRWRNQYQTFETNKIYSISRFHGTGAYYSDPSREIYNGLGDNPNRNPGIIVTSTTPNGSESLIHNYTNGSYNSFGAQWLNFAIYFPQIGRIEESYDAYSRTSRNRSAFHFTVNDNDPFFYFDNEQIVAGTEINTKHFCRSDLNKANFIEVTKKDIDYFIDKNNGFKITNSEANINLTGKYVSNFSKSPFGDDNYYFFKGIKGDCINFLKSVGIV